MNFTKLFTLLIVIFSLTGCQGTRVKKSNNYVRITDSLMENREVAILAAGCFWCVEAPLLLLDGVDTVMSGYIGGQTINPTYAQICTGRTGHAEAVKVIYDKDKISYDEILEVFFQIHDPTQLNRQGNDIGTQYRSAIFPVNEEQKTKAEYYIQALDRSNAYNSPIVTTIESADEFYIAEDYHQNYFNKNPEDRYCQLVARPKIEKLKKVFADKLKKN